MSQTKKPASNPFNDYVFVNATPAERGSFSLAMEKALEKLEKFQLPDASHFILQWIQGIVSSGAQNIYIQHQTQRLSSQYSLAIAFDGPGYTHREVQTLYDHVFLSGRDRSVDRLRELALGWLSACSLKPETLRLRSNGVVRLRDKENKYQEVCELVPELGESEATDQSSLHHLELHGKGSYDFQRLLISRCKDLPIPLHYNTEQISSPMSKTGVPWPNLSFESGPTKGQMGATYGEAASSQIAFLRYGVVFVSRPEKALTPPVILRATDPTLSKNVSQTDVVRDDAYDEFLDRVRAEMREMAIGLTKKRIPSYQRDSLNRFILSYIGSNLDIRALEDETRLQKLGDDYRDLLNFPVFGATGGRYVSLAQCYGAYQKSNCLIYSNNEHARGVQWEGLLLVIRDDEAEVLKKFCPRLTYLPIQMIRARVKAMKTSFTADELAPSLLATESINLLITASVPDVYPNGQALLQGKDKKWWTIIPGLPVSLVLQSQSSKPMSDTDVMMLAIELEPVLERLAKKLCVQLDKDAGFSRLRCAELLSEILMFRIQKEESQDFETMLEQGHKKFFSAPIIGLENGSMVSLCDLKTYLDVEGTAFIGGVFLDGLESGALDPMPCAEKLVRKLFCPSQLIASDAVQERLATDDHLRMKFRKQCVLPALASHPEPAKAIQNFAAEAAQMEAELERMEEEYRKALEGPELFVKPDEERLAELVESESEEGLLLNLTDDLDSSPSGTPNSSHPTPTDSLPDVKVLASLSEDRHLCAEIVPDFFCSSQSIHIERREDSKYSLHLATRLDPNAPGQVLILVGDEVTRGEHPLPLEGFIRVAESQRDQLETLTKDAVDQLIVKVCHTFKEGPKNKVQRQSLRGWLHHLCCKQPELLLASRAQPGGLYDLPLVPCLSQKFVSWRTLEAQYKRDQYLLVCEPDSAPCSTREVVVLGGPLSQELLGSLALYQTKTWRGPAEDEDGFESLCRSTKRDLSSILAGTDTPLLQPGVMSKLADDASMWRRWKTGFLSWDSAQSVAVLNPNHKVGKKIIKRYGDEPRWSAVFACALFSTINRGLEEVEDHHERAFLEALVDSLE